MAGVPIRVELTDAANIEYVRAKVASGRYASEQEVILDGLSALRERENEFELWLREVGAASYDEYHADPATGVSIDDAKAYLEESRLKRAAARS